MSSAPTQSDAQRSFFMFVRDNVTNEVTLTAVPSDTQIGLFEDPAELTLTGRLTLATNDYTVAARSNSSVSFPIAEQDGISSVYVTNALTVVSGSVSCSLPTSPRKGTLRFVKDASGTADNVPLVVFDPTGATIDGAPTLTLSSSYASTGLYWAGPEWKTVGGGGGGGSNAAPGVKVEDHGTLVSTSPFTTLNFSGSGVSVTNAGGGTALIIVSASQGASGTQGLPGASGIFTLSSSNPWVTAFDIDYTNNGSRTFDSPGAYTSAGYNIGGIVHYFTNSLSASSAATMTPGTGISLTAAQFSFFNTVDATAHATTLNSSMPFFRVNLSASVPKFDLTVPLRVWLHLLPFQNTVAHTSPGDELLVEYTTDATTSPQMEQVYNFSFFGGAFNLGGSSKWGNAIIDYTADRALFAARRTGAGNPTATSPFLYDVMVMELPLGIVGDGATCYLGNMTGSSWPAINSLVPVVTLEPGNTAGAGFINNPNAATFDVSNVSQYFASFGNLKQGSTDTSAGVYKRFRVDYAQPAGTVTVMTGTFNITQSFTINNITQSFTSSTTNNFVTQSFTGTVFTDGGGKAFTTSSVAIDPTGAFAPAGSALYVSGGAATLTGGITGSLTQVSAGLAYIVALGGITATTNSLGQVVLSGSNTSGINVDANGVALSGGPFTTLNVTGSGAHVSGLGSAGLATLTIYDPWNDLGAQLTTTSSVSIDGLSRAASVIGADVVLYVSGSPTKFTNAPVVAFGIPVMASASVTALGAGGFTGSLTRTSAGLAYIVGTGNVTTTTNSLGQVVINGTGGSGTGTSGGWTDTGVGALFTTSSISVDGTGKTASQGSGTDTWAWFSGTIGLAGVAAKVTVFGGDTYHSGTATFARGLTGSLTQVSPGLAYIVALGTLSATTNSSGQVVLVGGANAQAAVTGTWRDAVNALVTTGSVSIDTGNLTAAQHGTDTFFYVSGSHGVATGKSVFGGDLIVSGGITGSLTQVSPGVAYIVPLGSGLSAATNSLGQVTLVNSRPGDDKASYTLVSSTASLPNARSLAAGTGITFSDGGAGGTLTISANGQGISTAGGWTDAGNKVYTTGSVAIDGGNGNQTADHYGTDNFFYVSGTVGLSGSSAGKIAVFDGDVFLSGGISGPSGSNIRGSYVNRPGPGYQGRIYFCTDAPFMYFDNGKTWDQFGPVFYLPSPTGPTGSWGPTNFNVFSTDALTNVGDSTFVQANFPAGVNTLKCWLRGALSSTGSFTLTTAFVPKLANDTSANNFVVYALVLYSTSSGRFLTHEVYNNGGGGMASHIIPWTNSTTRPATGLVEGSNTPVIAGGVTWMRMKCLGNSQFTFDTSADGQNWVGTPFNAVTSSPSFGNPSHYGIGMYAGSGAAACTGSMVVMSLQQG